MIDLFSVKLNNNYDEIGATPTIENGTFLCDTTSENYTRGYSYQITNSNAERIEAAQDYKIKNAIYPTIQSVCEWLNNYFLCKPKNKCEYNDWFCNGDRDIKTNDLLFCVLKSSGFSFVGYATVMDNNITIDNPLWNAENKYQYHIMHVPQDFELAISQMIFYDVFTRGTVDDLKSESVGNYSYSKEDVHIGSLAYPSALVAGLEACYRKVRFVQ